MKRHLFIADSVERGSTDDSNFGLGAHSPVLSLISLSQPWDVDYNPKLKTVNAYQMLPGYKQRKNWSSVSVCHESQFLQAAVSL